MKRNSLFNKTCIKCTALLVASLFLVLSLFAQKEQKQNISVSTIVKTDLGIWKQFGIDITGKLSNSNYARSRQFFLVKSSESNLNIVWQDDENLNVNITRISKDLKNANTILASVPPKTKLLAVTNDENDNFYLVVFTEAKEKENDFITLCKIDKSGNLIAKKVHSSLQKDLDIYRIGEYAGTMVYSNGSLGLFMARKMNKHSDGLNHQGGIGVVFDAGTLEIIVNTGQTSGHSFDNYLTKNQAGEFIGIDLGDNYPRGINLHKMSKEGRKCRLVYTFKTQHGKTENGYGRIFPEYKEISTSKQKFYQWSNDNNTYTELGGVVEVSDGYLVVFAGEPDAEGKSLNNSRIGENTDTRNLGFVKVCKDFYDYSKKDFILSKGIIEKGGFYTFGGSFTEQQNQGVTWLTKYKNKEKESACNIKTQLLPNGNILVLWTVTSNQNSSFTTMMICLDSNGKPVFPIKEIGNEIQLNRRDDILLIDNKVFSVNGKENVIKVSFFELK